LKNIFETGEFSYYRKEDLTSSRGPVELRHSYYGMGKPAIFISHKHDELEELSNIIGFLERTFNVNCYIDSRDPSLPKSTSGETAKRIKERIQECNKFILLATDGAIDSKWCNWELGYGDSNKTLNNVAIFPIKKKGSFDFQYRGNEYLEIYSSISYYGDGEKYNTGKPIEPGYYVLTKTETTNYIVPLASWLKR
jgi:hypothetical protein